MFFDYKKQKAIIVQQIFINNCVCVSFQHCSRVKYAGFKYAVHSFFRKILVRNRLLLKMIVCYFLIALLLTLFTEEKIMSKLQHTDDTLLAMFCSNMAAEIAKLSL